MKSVVKIHFKEYSLFIYFILTIATLRIFLQATVLSDHARITRHVIGYKNFDTQGNFTNLLCQMDNLMTNENLRYGNACLHKSEVMTAHQWHHIVISVPDTGIQKMTMTLEHKLTHTTLSIPHTHPMYF